MGRIYQHTAQVSEENNLYNFLHKIIWVYLQLSGYFLAKHPQMQKSVPFRWYDFLKFLNFSICGSKMTTFPSPHVYRWDLVGENDLCHRHATPYNISHPLSCVLPTHTTEHKRLRERGVSWEKGPRFWDHCLDRVAHNVPDQILDLFIPAGQSWLTQPVYT